MSRHSHGRRDFLKTTGLGMASLALANMVESAHGFQANDTINIGCIGTGGRCRRLMGKLKELPNVKLAAVCDIWDDHLEQARKIADKNAFATKNFHELLARNDIDAVLIGSPDHWHVPMTIAACAAGKDVYVEKPLTHNLAEGDSVIKAQADSKAVVQVGTQQRSMPQFAEALKLLHDGVLGDIYKVHLTWNRNTPRWVKPNYKIDPQSVDWKSFLGNAPQQPFDEYRFRNWRWFWDFGGGIFTDLMVHWIDVIYWYFNLDKPATAASIGDHFKAADLWETPDTVQTILRYPEQHLQVYFEGTFVNARNRAMIEIMGSEGTLYLDRGRYELHPDPHKQLKPETKIFGTDPRGADFDNGVDGDTMHLANWIECIRNRKTPNAPVTAAVKAAAAAHYANLAYRQGKTIQTGD